MIFKYIGIPQYGNFVAESVLLCRKKVHYDKYHACSKVMSLGEFTMIKFMIFCASVAGSVARFGSFVHCQALALQANQSAASAVLALDHTLREVTYARQCHCGHQNDQLYHSPCWGSVLSDFACTKTMPNPSVGMSLFPTEVRHIITGIIILYCSQAEVKAQQKQLERALADGIQSLQKGQLSLQETLDETITGQESHHMQHKLQYLQQKEMVCLLLIQLCMVFCSKNYHDIRESVCRDGVNVQYMQKLYNFTTNMLKAPL